MKNRNDEDLRVAITGELHWDTRIDERNVQIEVDRRIVRMRGSVESWPARLAAEEAVRRVEGVVDVANDLMVRLPASAVRSDRELEDEARRALASDVLVPHEYLRLRVADGVITLEGTVLCWTQREDAARALRNLVGVVEVKNLVDVEPPLVPAERLRKTIADALDRHATKSAASITLGVEDGTVTISGEVGSPAERIAIEDTVRRSPGVRQVVSHLVSA